jgi:Uma2 family endonuclease
MSTITSTPTMLPPWAPSLPRRITVDEYDRMTKAGILKDPGKVELINGFLVEKMAKSAEHSYSMLVTNKSLEARLPAGWSSRPEQPVRIPDHDEPEPDVSVVRGSVLDYRHRIPMPADIALLAEVSESSLASDRVEKLLIYARAGIPVYWIVNLVNRQVEVYSRPGKKGYRSHKSYVSGQQVPVTIDGQQLQPIAVDDLLP